MNSNLYLEHDGKVLLVDLDGKGPQDAVMGRVGQITLRLPTVSEVEAMGIPSTIVDPATSNTACEIDCGKLDPAFGKTSSKEAALTVGGASVAVTKPLWFLAQVERIAGAL